jgi:hypothetical protein
MRDGGPMRLIKTYLLRIYADTEVTQRICGDIRPVDEKHSYPFKNIDELITYLGHWIMNASNATPPQDSGKSQTLEDPESK